MERRPHILTPNKQTFKPGLHIFFDVESDVGEWEGKVRKHTFKLGWALFWRRRLDGKNDQLEWYEMKDEKEFWDWVEAHTLSKTRLLLIAHNIDYDASILGAFYLLPERGWEMTKHYVGTQVGIYTFCKGSKTIQLVDNCNWFKGSLKGWGEVVGVHKLEVDPLTADRETLRKYCRRDVQILYELWCWWYRFCDEHDLGTWGITLPSQAFLAFRHKFMNHHIYIHAHSEALILERQAYHGGRTECFYHGESFDGPFYKLDVNSMYPYVMRNNEYPISLYGYQEETTIKGLRYFLSKYAVVAEVDLYSTKPYFPVSRDGRIVYSVGRTRTVLSTPELRLALDNGWVERVHRIAWYKKAPIFRDYVDYFYRLKERYNEEGNKLLYMLAKLLLNSLYGKFGQRKTETIIVGECDPMELKRVYYYDPVLDRSWIEYHFGGKIWRTEKGGESYHSFPAIAAHVTAYARIQLYKMVESVDRENCYYIDTDSLIVNQEGYNRLAGFINPHVLGMLKEEERGSYLRINAPKDYILGDKVVLKGVKKDAKWLSENVVEQEIFPSFRGNLARGDTKIYKTYLVQKFLERKITSGVEGEDGRILPLGFIELPGVEPIPW